MPINQTFLDFISPNSTYLEAVKALDEFDNDSLIVKYYESLAKSDPLISPGDSDAIYKTVFAQTVAPKIVDAIKVALRESSIPYISISFGDLDRTRQDLGYKQFGSPQDVLYTFTSDRASDWGSTLSTLLFRSACMVGEARVLVTIAPRFLDVSHPDFETEELKGAISQDFWESTSIVGSQASFKSTVEWLACSIDELHGTGFAKDKWTLASINQFLRLCRNSTNNKLICLSEIISQFVNLNSQDTLETEWLKQLAKKSKAKKSSQEQIALKYIEEGRFLQKLLGGVLVDHLQSNVKMQKNTLRGNKVEVDSIYRAIGRKQIILVEAKDSLRVSRTQLYSIYETYRLRIPQDWDVVVVAALLSKPESANKDVSQIIDLVEVNFDDAMLGKIPESLLAIKPKTHYRWKIKG